MKLSKMAFEFSNKIIEYFSEDKLNENENIQVNE